MDDGLGPSENSDTVPSLKLTRGTVEYEVQRRRRKTVGVTVRPDGSVQVHAPMRASLRSIRSVVEEFRPWIERKRRAALANVRRKRPRRFDDGETFPYLGGELTLRVVEAERHPVDAVVRAGDEVHVTVPVGLSVSNRRAVTRYALVRWLLCQAQEVFHRRHVLMSKRVGRAARRVVIKDMRSRWGSCGPSRRMSLNWRLIMAPLEVIDYVLVHELTHIFEDNHGKAFWRRVERAMPGFEPNRDWLKKNGAELEL